MMRMTWSWSCTWALDALQTPFGKLFFWVIMLKKKKKIQNASLTTRTRAPIQNDWDTRAPNSFWQTY